jgi:hypothetical protein
MASSQQHYNTSTPYMDTAQKYPDLFPEMPEDRMAFPKTSVDAKSVTESVYKAKLMQRKLIANLSLFWILC